MMEGNFAEGMASITINSSTAGQVLANAFVDVTVGGVLLGRDTDPATTDVSGPSGGDPTGQPAVKIGTVRIFYPAIKEKDFFQCCADNNDIILPFLPLPSVKALCDK